MKFQYIIVTYMLICAANCVGAEVMGHKEGNMSLPYGKMLSPHTTKKFSPQNQPHPHHEPSSLQDELVSKAVATAKEDEVKENDIAQALKVREQMIKNIPSLEKKSFFILEDGFLSFENNL